MGRDGERLVTAPSRNESGNLPPLQAVLRIDDAMAMQIVEVSIQEPGVMESAGEPAEAVSLTRWHRRCHEV
jgi:hypothetical protein